MTRGVTYLFTGTKHAVVAAVSALTLREHWHGPVSFFCDETALPFAEPIAEAASINIVRFEPVVLRRHSGFYNKTLLPGLSPYDETIQLDLDTTTVGPLDGLWPKRPDEWVLTHFANWRSDGNIIAGRIRRWAEAAPKLVQHKIAHPGPALNTGIMAYGPDCWLATHAWHSVTRLNLGAFLGDENAADLMIAQPHWAQYIDILDDRWNWSPVYSEQNADKRIIHGHGSKFFKRRSGLAVWQPAFARAFQNNFGDIQRWYRRDGNKHFARVLMRNQGLTETGFDIETATTEQG